jgi:peptidoglycan/LPS O-acetylase OafA/YrhL
MSALPSPRGNPVRQDIQLLRGVAVLAVLLYHSQLVPVAGGYLGVDIFFVISGFLITKNILTDISLQRFSFLDFYSRRARRLLPAAYCTLIVTTLLASKILTEDRWSDYIAQLLGALTFTANFVLPLQTGYFETAAETKPLLHIWSLSLEEQYYFLAPLLLVLLRPRWRVAALLALALLSFALCVALISSRFTYWRLPNVDSQAFAFFMLPTRAWQLLAGSLLACIALAPVRFNPSGFVKLVALALLCILCVHPLDPLHPRGDALLAVLLTCLLIAGDGKWIGNSLPVRAVARVGDWSYSLYLIHWPLFALATSAYLGQVPTVVRAGLVLLSIVLAYLQYEYVEQRFRHGRRLAGKQLLRLAAVTATVAALPFALASVRLQTEPGTYAYLHQPNHGLSAPCSTGGAVDDPAACSTSAQPRVALWGDSYAMHLVPGLLKVDEVGPSMMQITKGACAPVRGVASIDENYDAAWAKTCLAFNERAFKLIAETESIKYVIMSSPYSGYLDPGALKLFEAGESKTSDRSVAIERLIATVRDLQARGKQPILVAPPPRPGFNVGACREQAGSGLLVLGRSSCDFQLAEHESYQRGVIDGLREVHQRTGAALIWLDGHVCSNGLCETLADTGFSVYKDGGHLSVPGSIWLIPKIGIAQLVQN